METKDFHLKLKALSGQEEGAFTGLAAVYGDVDLGGDRILPGAFSKSIADQPGTGFPLLWSHKGDEPIGTGRVSDSRAGLMIEGKLLLADPAAQRAYLHLQAGSIRGLSIGYSIPSGGSEYRDDIRVLKTVRLHEVSLVATPMAPRALVASVKSLSDARHVVRSFRTSDALGADALDELRELELELKSVIGAHDTGGAELLIELKRLAALVRGSR